MDINLNSTKNIKILIFIFLIALYSLAIFSTLNVDLKRPSFSTMTWNVNHDEKLLIPNSRSKYLFDDWGIDKYNYHTFFFSFLGTIWQIAGLKIAGLSLAGIRLSYAIFSLFSAIILGIIFYRKVNSLFFAAFLFIYLFSYNNLCLARLAILEHLILVLMLLIFAIYFYNKDKFINSYLKWVAFATPFLFLIKMNFPLYLGLFLMAVIIIHRDKVILKTTLKYFLIGIAGFIGLLVIIYFVNNKVVTELLKYLSVNVDVMLGSFDAKMYQHHIPVLQQHSIFTRYYGSLIFFNPVIKILIYIFIVLCILLLVLKLIFRTKYSLKMLLTDELKLLLVYNVLYIIIHTFFYYYDKRGYPLFVFSYLVICLGIYNVYNSLIGNLSSELKRILTVIFIVIILILADNFGDYTISSNVFMKGKNCNLQVSDNSKLLDELLPKENTVVAAHCYPVRFLCLSKRALFYSGDDQLVCDSDVLKFAVKNKIKYVITAYSIEEIEKYKVILGNNKCKKFKEFYFDSDATTSVPFIFNLYNIDYGRDIVKMPITEYMGYNIIRDYKFNKLKFLNKIL